MSSVNKVILIGNLGRDPEIRTTQNGNKIANLSVATSESWKDRNTGERKERTEWHRVVLFNEGLVNVAENYLNKGLKVYIEGQLETRKWQDQQGKDNYSTEVVLRPYRGELTMLDSRQDRQQFSQNQAAPAMAAAQSGGPQQSGNPFGDPGSQSGAGDFDAIDDDIPF